MRRLLVLLVVLGSAPVLSAQSVVGDGADRHIVPAVAGDPPIVINIPQRRLFFRLDGRIRSFPIAVGKPSWRTPIGPFTIVDKRVDPAWHVPDSIKQEALRAGKPLPDVVPPGPQNPLGKYWLGLSIGGVGIHGTNAPASVGKPVTHGCMRMDADDIAWLFPRIDVGMPGRLIYQPLLLAASGDDVFIEVQRDIYQMGPRDPLEFARDLARGAGLWDRIDWRSVEYEIQQRAGLARPVTALSSLFEPAAPPSCTSLRIR